MPDRNSRPNTASSITVVIPAKNEVRTIAGIVAKAKKHAAEVIVVDGHSTDGTTDEAQRAGAVVVQDHGKGKGDAIRTVIPFISKQITVFMDADGSHDPEDIPRLVRPIADNGADHVSGSRLLGGSSELHGGFDEFLRLTGSSFITACIGFRFKARISESQNGFRAIKTEVLKKLDLGENSTTIEQEMVIKTLRKGFRLDEVPTHEYARAFGRSHIRISRVWPRYVYSLIKYLFF
jgi:glycosyltransferase involved in cell wall biosynthesis